MTLTKIWLQKEIDSEPNPAIKIALERVYQKYTEPPLRGVQHNQTVLKEFDRDATYNKVVKFYMDKKGYTQNQANQMAQQVVTREIQRRNLT